MKKLLLLIMCSTLLFISGCNNNSSVSTNSEETIEELNLSDYFTVDAKDEVIDEFMTIDENYNFEQYINNHLTTITIDDCTYYIKESKFSDLVDNLKQYVTDQSYLQYLDNPESTIEDGTLDIKFNLANATSIVVRFRGDSNSPVKDYLLSSFTVVHDVSKAKVGDKLTTNLKCVIPLTITEEVWKSKITDSVSSDNGGINSYYNYHNSTGFVVGDITIKGYSVQASFDRDTGHLVNLAYEVNSQ